MGPELLNLFEKRSFTNRQGEQIAFNSETSTGQCLFIADIVERNDCRKTLEIGFAFGMSALAILEAVSKKSGRHCIIDPFQHSEWGGNGLDLVNQFGFSPFLEFHEDYSYRVLPKFIDEGRRFDLAYIDSTKLFDWLMVDYFLIDKILKIGGFLILDDTGYYSVRKLSRFIAQLPHYSVYGQYPANERPGLAKQTFGKALRIIKKENLSKTYIDYRKGINAFCTVFRKDDEDKRQWNWHEEF